MTDATIISSQLATTATSIVHAFATDVILNADRTRMYIARDDGFVSIYDTFTGQVVQTFDIGTKLGGMDLSADGSFLLVVEKTALSSGGGQNVFAVHRVDVATGAVTDFTRTFSGIEGPFNDVALFADGTAIVTTTLQGSGATTTYRLDTQTGAFTTLASPSAQAPIVTAAADRLHILLTNGFNVSGPNQMYDLTAEAVIVRAASRGVGSSGNSLHAFTADGSLAAYVERQAGVDIFDGRLNPLTTLAGIQGNDVGGLAFDDHGDNLYVLLFSTREILKISTGDWSVTAHIDLPVDLPLPQFLGADRYGSSLVVGPDAQYFTWIASDDLFRIENPTALAPVQGTGAGETMTGTGVQDLLYGLGGDDILNGGDGDDTLRGGAGNDVLDGGAGHDAMYGGDGNDIYHVDDLRDRAAEADAAGGSDEVHASVSFALEGNIERLILTGSAAIDGTGNAIANVITGNDAANALNGMGGNDLLVAGGGGDFLNGGTGADEMRGGTGDDTYLVDNIGDRMVEAAGEGRDVVYATRSYALNAGAEIEILSTISQAAATAIDLAGNELNQEIYGNAGVNFLQGGGGVDYLIGLGGNDRYLVTGSGDHIVEVAGGGGRDVVYVLASYTLEAGAAIEVVSAADQSGTAPLALVGNALGQEIYGNAGANFLQGGGGTDFLVGLGGNDTYFVAGPGDNVVESVGGGSRDVVYTPLDLVMTAGQDIEVLSSSNQSGTNAQTLVGNGIAQEIYGSNGANFIDGGGGADFLSGLGGNDVYIVDSADDFVFESLGGGRDVVYARASYALGAGQEIEVLSAQSQSATNAIDLAGNNLANELYGNNGVNTLNGGGGADYLLGFGGADTFQFTTALGGGNVDALADFSAVDDTIALDDAVFAGLTPGALPASAFVAGSAAGDADDRIIYNSATGQILFDADGNGSGLAVLFATVQPGTILTAGDFTVI